VETKKKAGNKKPEPGREYKPNKQKIRQKNEPCRGCQHDFFDSNDCRPAGKKGDLGQKKLQEKRQQLKIKAPGDRKWGVCEQSIQPEAREKGDGKNSESLI